VREARTAVQILFLTCGARRRRRGVGGHRDEGSRRGSGGESERESAGEDDASGRELKVRHGHAFCGFREFPWLSVVIRGY
jgi:hypothetical protein